MRIIYEPCDDGWFVWSPDARGCWGWGSSLEGAREDFDSALVGWIMVDWCWKRAKGIKPGSLKNVKTFDELSK